MKVDPEFVLYLAKVAGFCFWNGEPHMPKGATIDWSSVYDKELQVFAGLLMEYFKHTATELLTDVLNGDLEFDKNPKALVDEAFSVYEEEDDRINITMTNSDGEVIGEFVFLPSDNKIIEL